MNNLLLHCILRQVVSYVHVIRQGIAASRLERTEEQACIPPRQEYVRGPGDS